MQEKTVRDSGSGPRWAPADAGARVVLSARTRCGAWVIRHRSSDPRECVCFDSDGGFHPRDPDYTVNGKLGPGAALNKIFNKGNTAHAVAGTTPISAEEGFIKLLARRAGDPLRGIGAYDATLTVKAASGAFKSQAMDLFAYRAIRGSARAVIASLTRHARNAVSF